MTKKLLVTALALVLAVSFAQAATLKLTAQVTNAYQLNTSTPVALPDITKGVDTPYTYLVKFYFTISDLGTEEGFGNLSMDLTLNDLTRPTGPTTPSNQTVWKPNNPTFTNFDEAQTPTYADTGDQGNDLKAILAGLDVASIPLADPDPRTTLGQGTPAWFGSVRVNWDGHTATTLDFGGEFSTFSNATLHKDPNAAVGGSIQFVPEPATMSLLALGGIGALLRRRK